MILTEEIVILLNCYIVSSSANLAMSRVAAEQCNNVFKLSTIDTLAHYNRRYIMELLMVDFYQPV